MIPAAEHLEMRNASSMEGAAVECSTLEEQQRQAMPFLMVRGDPQGESLPLSSEVADLRPWLEGVEG